jgi:hypothetical protein
MLFHFKTMLQHIYTLFFKENAVTMEKMISVLRHISVHCNTERYVTSQSQVMVEYLKTSKF